MSAMTEGASSVEAPQSSQATLNGATLHGATLRRVAPWPLKLAQIVTGYLLFRWLAALAGRYLLGYGVVTSLKWDGEKLWLDSKTRLLGRDIRRVEETFLASDLVTVGIEKRFPQLFLLLGALGTLLGAIVGVGWVIDGINASYVPLILVGLGVLAGGVLLDLIFSAVANYVGDRVSLILTVRAGRLPVWSHRVRIVGVHETRARRFAENVAGATGSAPGPQ